jgi:L-ascorbate metabolism protein UlaG (beta-lactamase superfamily)
MQLRPEFPEKQKTAEPAKPATASPPTEAPKPAESKPPEPKSTPAPASKKPEKKESTDAPVEAPKRVNVRWYGQSFVYLTTTTGVRVAIDPYGESTVTYPFPPRLSADVVLISNESEAYSSAERIFGSPLVFRSITSIGLNRASGFTFKGVHTYKDRDKGKRAGTNTIYTFTLDEVRFAHLGCLGHPLDSRIREEIGYVDVLFVPVGLKTLAVEEWRRIAKELKARVIVPVAYKSNYNANLDLRPLDEFLQGETNVVTLKSDQFDISHQELPVEPAIYIPQYP